MLPLVAEIGKPRDIQAWNADGELTTMSAPQSGRSLSRMRGKDGEEPGLGDSRPFTKGVARRKGSARGHGTNLPIAKRFRWREKLSADAWAPRPERVFFSSPLPAIRALICIHIRRLILIWSARSLVPQVGCLARHRRTIVWGKAPTWLTLLTVAVDQMPSSQVCRGQQLSVSPTGLCSKKLYLSACFR